MWEVVFHPILAAPHRIVLFYNGVPKSGALEVPVKGPGTEPWAGGIGMLIYSFEKASFDIFLLRFRFVPS